MVRDADGLIRDFLESAASVGLKLVPGNPTHEFLPAPHRRPALPAGKCAVYVFSLSGSYGASCPAGPDRALKVGLVGPGSAARFQLHHYHPSAAGSTLAKSVLQWRILWPYLGIERLEMREVGPWLLAHTDRDHFFLDAAENGATLRALEVYIRARLGSVYEGSASTGLPPRASGSVVD